MLSEHGVGRSQQKFQTGFRKVGKERMLFNHYEEVGAMPR